MNKCHPSWSAGGPKEERTLIGYKASSDSHYSYKCQSEEQEWKCRLWGGANHRPLGGRKGFPEDLSGLVGVFQKRLEKRTTHANTHVHTCTKPIERTCSDHNPLPPPPAPPLREGHHFGPNGSANSDPEPQGAHHHLHLQSTFSLFLSTSFYPCACSPPLYLLLYF